MKGETQSRWPGYQVLLYDVRSTTDTIRDVVLGNTLQTLTGPLDITNIVEDVKVNETAGSYTSGGVAATTVGLTVVDPNEQFDPLKVRADPTIDGRYFRSGNVLRTIEGDTQVPTTDWPITFTGVLIGQSGYDRNRTTGNMQLTLRALSREATFLGTSRTTEEFIINSTYLSAVNSVATLEMGLDVAELDLPAGFGAALIPHKVVQIAETDPISMLAYLMFLDQLIPRFTGEGKLGAIPDRATGAATRVYLGRAHIISIVRPFSDVDPPDSVCVKGLDSTLSRNDMPRQELANVDITTGYFTPPKPVTTYWRDDRTLFADNVELVVLISPNGGISLLGGGETFELVASGDPDQIGTVGGTLTVDTGFAPWLVVFLLVTSVALAAVPDLTVGFGAGHTIPIGRIGEAIAMAAAQIVMSKIGRGNYSFVGDPFEYVYREINECARISGTPVFTEKELVLENALVHTQAQAIQASLQALFRVQADKNPRNIKMIHDVGLTPNDLLELRDDGSKYLVVSINRTLTRDPKNATATVQALEVTDDVSVGT